MAKRIVITVDGLAGSGKTTLAKLLSQRLKFIHLNSGALYRTLALCAQRAGSDLKNGAEVLQILAAHNLMLARSSGGEGIVLLDGRDVSSDIRSPEVSEATSFIAALPDVRHALRRYQREAFPGESIVAEGRDMGTVIFPDADLKFFIEAGVEQRVERRLRDLEAAGHDPKVLKTQIKMEVLDRDRRDIERADSPTIPAKDAVIIDNSSRKLTDVAETLYICAVQRGLVSNDPNPGISG